MYATLGLTRWKVAILRRSSSVRLVGAPSPSELEEPWPANDSSRSMRSRFSRLLAFGAVPELLLRRCGPLLRARRQTWARSHLALSVSQRALAPSRPHLRPIKRAREDVGDACKSAQRPLDQSTFC